MAESITLKIGDVITIPDIGTRQIARIEQLRTGRYQINLCEKFKHDIVIDIITPGDSIPRH